MKCNICQLDKPETEFYPRKAERQGEYLSACKVCRSQKKKTEKYSDIETSREKGKEIMRKFRHNNPEKCKETHKKWRQKNKEKYNVKDFVRRAIKSGKLHKPKLCEFCFQPKPLQGHHEDYSKPLDVKWLCAGCHKSWHRWKIIFNTTKKIIKYPEKMKLSFIQTVEEQSFNYGFAIGKNKTIDDMRKLNGGGE